MLKFNSQMRLPTHINASSHVHTHICIHIYTQLAKDIILNAELNVPNYNPSPKDAISSFNLISFYQTTQDNGPTGTISLTHQEAL